jgi:hypothetical protein
MPDPTQFPQQPQPGQPVQPNSISGGPDLPNASPGPSAGRDKKLPASDRPGGPKDATQGKAPREALKAELGSLNEQWVKTYLARRRLAMEALTTPPGQDEQDLPEAPNIEPKEYPLPTDPYWDADAHTHNDRPDYEPRDLGLEVLNRIIANPADVNFDHEHYQRPTDQRLIDAYAKEPRQRLAERVGLAAIRSDGSMWVVDGQHHSLAAIREHINALTYQSFLSSGWEMEKQVYDRYHAWHTALHGKEHDQAHNRVAPDIPESTRRFNKRKRRR